MKLNIFLLSFYLLVNPQTVTSISQSSEKGELLPFSLHSPANSEKMSEFINSTKNIPILFLTDLFVMLRAVQASCSTYWLLASPNLSTIDPITNVEN